MSDHKYSFDSALYLKKAVESAVSDFSEFARFAIDEKDGQITVSAHPDPGTEINGEFWGEFSNHVLAQMA